MRLLARLTVQSFQVPIYRPSTGSFDQRVHTSLRLFHVFWHKQGARIRRKRDYARVRNIMLGVNTKLASSIMSIRRSGHLENHDCVSYQASSPPGYCLSGVIPLGNVIYGNPSGVHTVTRGSLQLLRMGSCASAHQRRMMGRVLRIMGHYVTFERNSRGLTGLAMGFIFKRFRGFATLRAHHEKRWHIPPSGHLHSQRGPRRRTPL